MRNSECVSYGIIGTGPFSKLSEWIRSITDLWMKFFVVNVHGKTAVVRIAAFCRSVSQIG